MTTTKNDLTGSKFNRLRVVGFGGNKGGRCFWECVCDCGKTVKIRGDALKSGSTKSCGCLSAEKAKEVHTKHGLSGKKIYWLYDNMVSRCTDTKSRHFKNYGGRGITVCDEWMESRDAFYLWAVDNGYIENLQIDRKDNNKGYSPDNCIFTKRVDNNYNRRCTRNFTINGMFFKSAKEAAGHFGVSSDTIRYWAGLHNKNYQPRPGCQSMRPFNG